MIDRELLPRALSYNLLATRIAAVLETPGGPIRLNERSRRTLEEARTFLAAALEGRRATHAMEVSEDALAASDAYGEAIQATEQLLHQGVQVPKEVEDLFVEFIGILDDLLAGRAVSGEKLELLRRFFLGLREAALPQISAPVEGVSLPEG
jgi:hypothetical protein